MVVRKLTRVVVSHKEYILHLLLCSDYIVSMVCDLGWGYEYREVKCLPNLGKCGEGGGKWYFILHFSFLACFLSFIDFNLFTDGNVCIVTVHATLLTLFVFLMC